MVVNIAQCSQEMYMGSRGDQEIMGSGRRVLWSSEGPVGIRGSRGVQRVLWISEGPRGSEGPVGIRGSCGDQRVLWGSERPGVIGRSLCDREVPG